MVLRRTEMLKNIQTNVRNLYETKIQQLNLELNSIQGGIIYSNNYANNTGSMISYNTSILKNENVED